MWSCFWITFLHCYLNFSFWPLVITYEFPTFNDKVWLSHHSSLPTPSLIWVRSIFKVFDYVCLFHAKSMMIQSLYCLFSLFSLESITLFLFSFAFIFCFCFSLSRNLRQRGKFSLTTSKSGSPFLRYTLPESLFTLLLCRLAPGWCPTNSLYHYCVDSLCLFLSVGSLVSWIPNLPLVLLPLWVVSL